MTTATDTTRATDTAPTPFDYAMRANKSSAPIRAEDPEAKTKLAARIADLKKGRDAMKAINAALRMKAVVTGNEKLRALGLEAKTIDYARASGAAMFPPWQLQNLGQNIARLEKRLRVIEAEETRAPAEEVQGTGYRVVENTDLNRIQILFDAKPDADTRAILKRNGFRWAPSQEAWQRHLNENGRYAAKRALASIAAA